MDAASERVLADVEVVKAELRAYGHGLAERPRLLVLNKIELLSEEHLNDLRDQLEKATGEPVLAVSAAASMQLDRLLAAVWQLLGVAS